MTATIPATWMPAARMTRIHIHWTAGSHKAGSHDRNAYHVLVEGDGRLVRGDKSIKANEPGSGMTPASHTLNANTGAIAVSMCGMAGATENPFRAGAHPITRVQWDAMVETVAALAHRYGITVTPTSILTHAEVQPNLGITQRGKWDITRLPFDDTLRGHAAVGDSMRLQIAVKLDEADDEEVPTGRDLPADMRLPRFRVTGVRPSTLNFRDAPNGNRKGALHERTVVEKIAEQDAWWQVRTLAGFVGWVYSSYLVPEPG